MARVSISTNLSQEAQQKQQAREGKKRAALDLTTDLQTLMEIVKSAYANLNTGQRQALLNHLRNWQSASATQKTEALYAALGLIAVVLDLWMDEDG